MANKTAKKQQSEVITLSWYTRKDQKFDSRYQVNCKWAEENTAEYFACGIDEPEQKYYRKIFKNGKLVCREAEYLG